jgi:prepilin-type N-terminal cleavage/methylation domain-containing protein
MTIRMRPRPLTRTRPRDDSGFTLVELLVAMGIFGVLLAVFATSITSFSRSTVRTYRSSDQATQSRIVFNQFDKQVRAASAITQPAVGTSGLNWYVEYRDETVVPGTCTQWVLRTDTDTLAVRDWTVGATSATAASAWRTLATNVVNTTAQDPFGLVISTSTVPRQRLTVSLRFQSGTGPLTLTSSTFVARNTSTLTETNSTGTPVCNFTGWRP